MRLYIIFIFKANNASLLDSFLCSDHTLVSDQLLKLPKSLIRFSRGIQLIINACSYYLLLHGDLKILQRSFE